MNLFARLSNGVDGVVGVERDREVDTRQRLSFSTSKRQDRSCFQRNIGMFELLYILENIASNTTIRILPFQRTSAKIQCKISLYFRGCVRHSFVELCILYRTC